MKINQNIHPYEDGFENDEKRYEWQMNVRANYLILGDKNQHVPIDIVGAPGRVVTSDLIWLHRNELIAGSFMSNIQSVAPMENKDIDIYFKCEKDAEDFRLLNKIHKPHIMYKSSIAMQLVRGGTVLNLIYGVAYDNANDLISHFDIRACSIAYDPQHNLVHAVRGAIYDAANKRIVFNPVPHNTTVARIMKYAQRGFDMDAYQRLFFTELIKSDMYNTDLELSTGYRAVHK
jgi:hypothetical protein